MKYPKKSKTCPKCRYNHSTNPLQKRKCLSKQSTQRKKQSENSLEKKQNLNNKIKNEPILQLSFQNFQRLFSIIIQSFALVTTFQEYFIPYISSLPLQYAKIALKAFINRFASQNIKFPLQIIKQIFKYFSSIEAINIIKSLKNGQIKQDLISKTFKNWKQIFGVNSYHLYSTTRSGLTRSYQNVNVSRAQRKTFQPRIYKRHTNINSFIFNKHKSISSYYSLKQIRDQIDRVWNILDNKLSYYTWIKQKQIGITKIIRSFKARLRRIAQKQSLFLLNDSYALHTLKKFHLQFSHWSNQIQILKLAKAKLQRFQKIKDKGFRKRKTLSFESKYKRYQNLYISESSTARKAYLLAFKLNQFPSIEQKILFERISRERLDNIDRMISQDPQFQVKRVQKQKEFFKQICQLAKKGIKIGQRQEINHPQVKFPNVKRENIVNVNMSLQLIYAERRLEKYLLKQKHLYHDILSFYKRIVTKSQLKIKQFIRNSIAIYKIIKIQQLCKQLQITLEKKLNSSLILWPSLYLFFIEYLTSQRTLENLILIQYRLHLFSESRYYQRKMWEVSLKTISIDSYILKKIFFNSDIVHYALSLPRQIQQKSDPLLEQARIMFQEKVQNIQQEPLPQYIPLQNIIPIQQVYDCDKQSKNSFTTIEEYKSELNKVMQIKKSSPNQKDEILDKYDVLQKVFLSHPLRLDSQKIKTCINDRFPEIIYERHFQEERIIDEKVQQNQISRKIRFRAPKRKIYNRLWLYRTAEKRRQNKYRDLKIPYFQLEPEIKTVKWHLHKNPTSQKLIFHGISSLALGQPDEVSFWTEKSFVTFIHYCRQVNWLYLKEIEIFYWLTRDILFFQDQKYNINVWKEKMQQRRRSYDGIKQNAIDYLVTFSDYTLKHQTRQRFWLLQKLQQSENDLLSYFSLKYFRVNPQIPQIQDIKSFIKLKEEEFRKLNIETVNQIEPILDRLRKGDLHFEVNQRAQKRENERQRKLKQIIEYRKGRQNQKFIQGK